MAEIIPTEDVENTFPDVNEPSPEAESVNSPRWGWATKLIISLVLIIGLIALIVRFNTYLKLLIIAILLSLLLYPLCGLLVKHLKIRWRAATAIVYISLAAIVIYLITWGGQSLIDQIVNLFKSLETNFDMVTDWLDSISNQVINIGPFLQFTTPVINTEFLTNALSQVIQPLEATNLAGRIVGSVGTFLLNTAITFMVSFFLTSESDGVRQQLFSIEITGHEYDGKRMGKEIASIFNSFVRGEFTVVAIAIVVYSLIMTVFGLPYSFVLALIAGFGRFIPYIGAWFGWIGFFVGALLQQPTPFGLTPFLWAVIVVVVAVFIDLIFDHVLMPKVMGNSLKLHPAAIMISALVGSQLFGLLGVILAAPIVAIGKLLLRYSTRKLLDQDPWEGMSYYQKPREPGVIKWLRSLFKKISSWLVKPWNAVKAWFRAQRTKRDGADRNADKGSQSEG